MSPAGRLRRRLFGVPSAQAVFTQPGFAAEAWARFGPVAVALTDGYHAALEDPHLVRLAGRLDEVDPAWQGFAYEGAGMGLAALDAVAPWSNRVATLDHGAAARHRYPFYVGLGLAYARLRRSPEAQLAGLDPLLGWVTADGYGFHEAFFHRRATVEQHRVPARLTAYGRRMFDQGVGRALWFSSAGSPGQAAALIEGFPAIRHHDLWSGVGLATAYGGGTTAHGLRALQLLARPYGAALARGAATAAWGRSQAGTATEHTDLACAVLCDTSTDTAAAVVERARWGLPATDVQPLHELWRQRVEDDFQHRSGQLTSPPRPPANSPAPSI